MPTDFEILIGSICIIVVIKLNQHRGKSDKEILQELRKTFKRKS
jgi:hypothetical protein